MTREKCSRAINRLKSNDYDINKTLSKGATNPDWNFEDDTFSFPESLHWTDLYGVDDYSRLLTEMDWARVTDRFGGEEFSFWGSEDNDTTDSIQGDSGNCWMMSGFSSIA